MDERNFRSAYYEKVGFKSVEEKRSLEILLKDEHLDISKLRQFCLRFGVPVAYRNLIWKLLLGVLPSQMKCHCFVMDQRKEEYNNLLHALNIMKITNNLSKSQIFLAIWLLQSGHLNYMPRLRERNDFLLIVRPLIQYFDNDTDIYWIAKNFYDHIGKFQPDIKKLIDSTHQLLEKEDPYLYNFFQDTEILNNIPFDEWYHCCFAGILNESAVGKIWDKICAGSYKILIYVAVILLTSLKHRLLSCKDLPSCMKYINSISEEISEVITNKSIELWQKQGSPLTVYDKPKP